MHNCVDIIAIFMAHTKHLNVQVTKDTMKGIKCDVERNFACYDTNG